MERSDNSCAKRISWRGKSIHPEVHHGWKPVDRFVQAIRCRHHSSLRRYKNRGKATAIINQLLRSGTSIGANIHEANYASSKADFINKLQIALKECYETDYWLDIFHESGLLKAEEYNGVFSQCSKLRKLLIASVTTAKKNPENHWSGFMVREHIVNSIFVRMMDEHNYDAELTYTKRQQSGIAANRGLYWRAADYDRLYFL